MPVRLNGSSSGYTDITASAVAGNNTLTLPTTSGGTLVATDSSGNTNITNLAASGNISAAGTMYMSSSFLRNRIINGDMRIDQRNAGAAVTVNSGADFFPVDRWACSGEAADGVFTAQQSSTAPTGFKNSVVCTVTTADASIGATQRYFIEHKVEGYNVADLGFGTATPSTITISFWVRSSVTGTFGACVASPTAVRYYPFSYTISSANTWEQKTVTLTGDTTGSWNTTTSTGIEVLFNLGCGSSRKATANTWTSSISFAPTGSVDLISTLSATFYITGVQLEAGSVATPFERRLYGQELALCQRYYEKSYDTGTAVGASTTAGASNFMAGTNFVFGKDSFKQTKRALPTTRYWDTVGNLSKITIGSTTNSSIGAGAISPNGTSAMACEIAPTITAYSKVLFHWDADSEL